MIRVSKMLVQCKKTSRKHLENLREWSGIGVRIGITVVCTALAESLPSQNRLNALTNAKVIEHSSAAHSDSLKDVCDFKCSCPDLH
jgi:hypothetical protein